MIARDGSGWQTMLADLSLILFMVMASAVKDAPYRTAPAPSARSEPVAVWRDQASAPPLADWLSRQAHDPRQQLTIHAAYGAGEQVQALAAAQRLLAGAGAAGASARIVIEPGATGIAATLGYDQPTAKEPS